MRDSIHQKQTGDHGRTIPEDEEKLKDEQYVVDAPPRDITRNEHIEEVDEAAGSAEGIEDRNHELGLRKDVEEDREDNNEGRLPDIPPSAIHQ